MKRFFLHSVMAGVVIGVGGCVYLSCESRYLGAVLFSFGLFVVCEFGLPLYTGRCGYLPEQGKAGVPALAVALAGNLAGAFLTGVSFSWAAGGAAPAAPLCAAKLAQTWPQTLVRAFFCGLVVFVTVEAYRRSPRPEGKYLAILLGVPAFILPGFEHCIADAFYFAAGLSAAGGLRAAPLLFLSAAVTGNTLGAAAAFLSVPRPAKPTA